MTALWMPTDAGRERLLLVRLVRIEEKEVCQGVVLDDDALRLQLADKVSDLFPHARLLPVHDGEQTQPEQTMTALPFQLDAGPAGPPPDPGWTALRVGLVFAWTAAIVALAAVGLGGWSLIDLSERRIRFVSTVTHELRTPLTTLRLYLDMLMNGLVRDEKQREEYIRTLNAEANRLNRLVGNVLDYSRLENQRPRLARSHVAVADLMSQVASVWEGRCRDADKELVIENGLADGAALCTDGELVQQILGNLLDNACKYSRGAADRHVWLRVRGEGKRVAFEVEDRGPGVPKGERRSIFRAFRRGRDAEAAAGGGVGLGLALARRWAGLLGGDLALRSTAGGASFRLTLPAESA
jgi:signal transduction histidine kinase